MNKATRKRLTAWLLTLVMALSLLPAAALADEVSEDLAPPAPQEENYGYVRLVFSEGEQIDLYHGEYITECSPTAEVLSGADEDFIANGEYAALYYEGRLYHYAALDGVSINADAVLPAEAFALVPMGEERTALAAETEDESSGTGEAEEPQPSTEPEPPAPPKSTEEDKTTEGEGGSSGSGYGIGDDTQPRGSMRMPVMPTATGDYPSGVFLPNGTTNDGIYLFNGQCLKNNSATSSTPYTSGMDYVARYDETTGTLYLNGYDGVANVHTGIGTRYSGVLTIEVERDSTITVNGTGENSSGLERRGINAPNRLVISGNGKLTINVTCSGDGYGIYAYYGMEITAPLEVKVSVVNAPTDDKVAYGLYAYSGDISLSGGNKTIRVGSEKTANGIFNYITESGQNIIKGNVTLVQTSGEGGSGIFSGSGPVTLDKAIVNISGNFSNGILTRCANKSENITIENHSDVIINLPDGANNNGLCIYGNGSEKNLTISDSTVNIQTNGSPVFVDGTGSSVSIKDSIVDLTKTADGHPVISTKTGSQNSIDLTNSGRVTMTATGNQEYPLFPNLSTITTNTKCTVGGYVDQWKAYVGQHDSGTNTTVLEFVHHESDRQVILDDITIAGQTNDMLSNEIPDFKLTLQDDFFSDEVRPYIMVDEWFSNRPDGVGFRTIAVDKETTPNTATIQVYGTPTVRCIELIKVEIPGKYLRSGNPIAASAPNLNARFDIKQTLTESAATITPPVVGQTAGESNAVTSGDPAKYTVTVDHWEESGNGSMSSTDVFQANQGYYCFLKVTPQPGYAFAQRAGCSVNKGSSTATFAPDNNGLYKVPINPCQSAISLDLSGTVQLENKQPGETFPTQDITVTNLLASPISNIPITLSDPTHFQVTSASISSIPANGTGTFQVAPAPNLSLGEYSTKVTVGGGSLGEEQSFYVEFSVREVIMLTANPLTYNGELQTGVTASEADVTIEGNSQRDAGNYTAKAYLKSGFYMWEDHTMDSTQDISWSIGKRDPHPDDIVVTPPTNAVYDGNRKEATAELDSKYTGAGAITISKYVDDTGNAADPINAGTYTVYVNVAGGSNFNSATDMNDALSPNWKFTIYKAGQDAPVGLSASAPTSSSGKGKINGTTANMQYNTNPDATTSWKNCTAGSTAVAPGTYYVRCKGDANHDASPNVKVIVPEYGAGVTVSGTAVSWNDTDNAVFLLYDSSTSDTDIKADMKLASSEKALAYTAAKGGVAQNADGKRYDQTFSFSTVPAGTYKLAIYKPGKYVPKIITVIVGSSDAALGEVKLWLYGDVTYDGKVTGADASQILRYTKLANSVFTSGTEQEKADRLETANVTYPKNGDTEITGADASQILRYTKLASSVFDYMD